MSIEKLFTGIAVVIDDEVNDEKSNICQLLSQVNKREIPYITFEEIPSDETICHFDGVSFVLLDWMLNKKIIQEESSGVKLPSGLEKALIDDNIDFLKKLKNATFSPVFIFTNENQETVILELKSNNLYFEDKPNFIFVRNKEDLIKGSSLFQEVETWIMNNPPIYVLLEWNKRYQFAKNCLFWDLYERSPLWPKILWKCYKEDKVDMSRELGDMITRSLYTRIPTFAFNEHIIEACATTDFDPNEVRNVLEGERFIKNDYLDKDYAYTGDVFKEIKVIEGKERIFYWLNIRAQCDLLRDDKIEIYCIRGRQIDEESDQKSEFIKGQFIEKKNNVIVACIDDGKIIDFSFTDLKIFKWKEMKDKRIGNLLPPFITRIQQLYSVYFQRQGVPRNPDEAFPKFIKELEEKGSKYFTEKDNIEGDSKNEEENIKSVKKYKGNIFERIIHVIKG